MKELTHSPRIQPKHNSHWCLDTWFQKSTTEDKQIYIKHKQFLTCHSERNKSLRVKSELIYTAGPNAICPN